MEMKCCLPACTLSWAPGVTTYSGALARQVLRIAAAGKLGSGAPTRERFKDYDFPMTQKIRWGVLSTANIGLKKVLPAMQVGQYSTVAAIASRELKKAQEAAGMLGIPTAYGSYEELLADPNIDAIYNPLPNQQHGPWTITA